MSRQQQANGRAEAPDAGGTSMAGHDVRGRLLAGIPLKERRLPLAGASTAVLEGGEGPPLVLLHSSGEFAAVWMRVIPELVTAHRVVAPDLPGHGASDVGDAPLDAERMLAWLGQLVERTCPSPPVLVGRGLGGALAARFAVDAGARLERLVLVDAFGLADFDPTPGFGLAASRFLEQPTERTRDELFGYCFVDLDGVRAQVGERWAPLAAYTLERARTAGLRTALDSLMPQFGLPAIAPADLARIAVPTSLIWGRQNLQVRLAVAEAASARHGWPLHVIDNAGDDAPMEQPQAFLAALRHALETFTGAGASP
jgi:pimeloyl-ACP methyl ester carboxylesterase